MTRDDIIRMAREADHNVMFETFLEEEVRIFERFAALVAAAEREECAKVCEEWGAFNKIAAECAEAIRARGKE